MNTEQRNSPDTRPKGIEASKEPKSEFAGEESKVFSIEAYMRKALAAMQQRFGWLKENPSTQRAREAAATQPDVEAALNTQLNAVEQRAESALHNAEHAISEVLVEDDTEANTELQARAIDSGELEALDPVEDIPAVEVSPDAPTERMDRTPIAGAPERTSFDIARLQVEVPSEVAWRLNEHAFRTQESFEEQYRMFESAAHVDSSLVPQEQQALVRSKVDEARQILDAFRAVGSRMGYAEQGSYVYLVDSYKAIEGNLLKVQEALESVQQIMRSEGEASHDTEVYAKEIQYLKHLRSRAGHSPRNRMHAQVERFIAQNQDVLKEDDVKMLGIIDTYVDSAEDSAFAQEMVNEAIDAPARLVLRLEVEAFKADYGDFLMPGDRIGLDNTATQIEQSEGPIVYGQVRQDLQQYEYALLKKMWPMYINSARRRIDSFGKRYGESLTKTDKKYIATAVFRLAEAQTGSSIQRGKQSLKEFMSGIDILLDDIDRRHRPRRSEQRPSRPVAEETTGGMAAAAK